ncbi:MAG: TatD family hydrolase [bacterium]
MIDTHAHLNFNNFKDNSKDIIKDCLYRNIRIINIGSQYETSRRAVQMAVEYEKGVYAAIGIHPIHLSQMEIDEEDAHFKSRAEKFDKSRYIELLSKKVIAIGEIGLDYFHIPDDMDFEAVKKIQKKEFIAQLKFAKETNLPVILHCRGNKNNPFEAYGEILEIIQDQGNLRGVIHCFGANLEIAKKFLDLGFYIGFTGIITFKNALSELVETVKKIPLDRILIETDCPYLAPMPHRGELCVPQYAEFTLRKMAEIKGISFEEAEKQTDKNADKLFGIQ